MQICTDHYIAQISSYTRPNNYITEIDDVVIQAQYRGVTELSGLTTRTCAISSN